MCAGKLANVAVALTIGNQAAGSGGRAFDHTLDKWSPGLAGTGAPAAAVFAASRQYDSARVGYSG
jgi:hypothetical protein